MACLGVRASLGSGSVHQSGWELGAQATLTAQINGRGAQGFAGAMSVTPGVWLYQLNEEGLAVDFTAGGTKYFRGNELN